MNRRQMAQLFAEMQFCPKCGKGLVLLGTDRSPYKHCDNRCGVMSILNAKNMSGMFLEIVEE